MSGIGPLINEITNTNLVISTSSAKILAQQFKSSAWEFWLPLLTSVAAAVAAYMSFLASKQSLNLSHQLFLNELNKEYAALSARLFDEYTPNLPVSNKNKKNICNFFQKICGLYYHKLIKKEELSCYNIDLFNEPFVEYAKSKNKEERTLGSYIRWLHENKIITI